MPPKELSTYYASTSKARRLVYLAPIPWRSFTQRPHEFVRYFQSVTGGEALWIEPYPTRLPSPADLTQRRADSTVSDSEQFDRLKLLAPKALPIDPLPLGEAINGRLFWRPVVGKVKEFAEGAACTIAIGKPSALAVKLLDSVSFASALYDAMDDFPAFYSGLSRRSMEHRVRQVIRRVDRVLASSTALTKRLSSLGCHPTLVQNALNEGEFPDIRQIRSVTQGITVGYVGTVGSWFDWDLVARLARAKPDVTVQVIGPIFQHPPSWLPKNVHLLPPCHHAAAIAKMLEFDIGLIPFKRNRLTESVDPIKYYEYRAMGLSVMSTSFGEMAYRKADEGVFIIADDCELGRVMEAALENRPALEDVIRFRKENGWDVRFAAARIFDGVSQ